MRRIVCFTAAVALMVIAISVFWSYRVRAAEHAAQFPPVSIHAVRLPAGTAIEAALINGIASKAQAGDTVTAFVSRPVIIDGKLVIPKGARLTGHLDKLSVSRRVGSASLNFTVLTIQGRLFTIQTRRVAVVIPTLSDVDLVRKTLKTLMGAALGAAVAAESGDARLIDRGVLEGTTATLPLETVPIQVFLAGDLDI